MTPRRLGADPRIGPLRPSERVAWQSRTLAAVAAAAGIALAGVALFAVIWWMLGAVVG